MLASAHGLHAGTTTIAVTSSVQASQLHQSALTSVKQVERLSQRTLTAAYKGLESLEGDRGCCTSAVCLLAAGLLQHGTDEGLDVRHREAVRTGIEGQVLLVDMPLAVVVDGVECAPKTGLPAHHKWSVQIASRVTSKYHFFSIFDQRKARDRPTQVQSD